LGKPPAEGSSQRKVRGDSAAHGKIRWLAIVVAALGVAAAYFYWHQTQEAPGLQATDTATGQPPAAAEPAIRHPIEAPLAALDESGAPVPTLEESDAALRDGLEKLIGQERFTAFVYPDAIIRRIVATIDNLPRRKAPTRVWPVRPAQGGLIASGADADRIIDAANSARYAAYVDAVQAIDAHAMVDLYVRLYPLFQRAHEELGYPHGYFNDRVIEAIDDLLDAPEVKGPLKLTQPKVLLEFADPGLESRSAGQKLMIRIGAANAAIVKRKLREIHDQIMQRELRR
jgi:hypothetical protein